MARPPHHPPSPDLDLTLAGRPRPRRRAPRARRALPVTPDMLEGAPDFAPAPRGATRYDGWTPDRQRAFIKALAETGRVTRACAWVGMSNVGAYLLRKGDGVERLADIAYERAVYGVPVPVFHKGEQVGERRWYNDRLLMYVMRHADRERYDDAPKGNRVPPHIRKALREEWEREEAAKRPTGESARQRLAERIALVARRLEAWDARYPAATPDDAGPEGAPRDAAPRHPDGDRLDDEAGDRANAPLAPPAERRAEVEAAWDARRRRQDLAGRADIWATGDPRDAETNAATHWQAMVDAGLIGGGAGDEGEG